MEWEGQYFGFTPANNSSKLKRLVWIKLTGKMHMWNSLLQYKVHMHSDSRTDICGGGDGMDHAFCTHVDTFSDKC